jgi:aspartokinase/homoserine dehydrogenase 1
MKILKFGGTSVGSPEALKAVLHIVGDLQKQEKIAVVVSALGGVTDQLIRIAKASAQRVESYLSLYQELKERHLKTIRALLAEPEGVIASLEGQFKELENLLYGIFLIQECSLRTLDLVMSFGERLSAQMVTAFLLERGILAEFLDTRPLIQTDEHFGNARVCFKESYQNLREYFQAHSALQVATGFIGSTSRHETTTLGRGGSDYTASLLGNALDAIEVEIWTDVNGVMTADPRKVSKAFSIPTLSYEEAMEMSHFGAKVIHPPTMQPALEKNIPLRIKNTFCPEFEGTLIAHRVSPSSFPIKGISSIHEVALLRVQGSGMVGVAGISMRLFGSLARAHINIVLISQASSEHSICLAIEPKEAFLAKKLIEEEFQLEIQAQQIDPVSVEEPLSIIAVVGENMRNTPGVSGKLFKALGKNGVNVAAIAQGSSELNISVVIPQADESKALNALHDAFFLSDLKTVNLFIVGTGLIGKTLLQQLQKQKAFLKQEMALEIRVVALANRKKMLFQPQGIDPAHALSALEHSKSTLDLPTFLHEIERLNLAQSVFVDCTASETLANAYPEILKQSISIVTPNKRANSGKYVQYQKLKNLALRHNVKFLYETTVGAGLPVISVLQDLRNSGDQILKIEAVLSGSLSYIFNTFDGTRPFSTLVQEARQKGYTEPDPRDDLSGMDVARKLLILAREIGVPLELSDIQVENLVPPSCQTIPDLSSFFEAFSEHDSSFLERYQEAKHAHKKLVYLACFEEGQAQVRLTALTSKHPFYSLSGSDNMIAFTTARYREQALVIKGPGAGAEVTAAGVFADIIKISNYLL